MKNNKNVSSDKNLDDEIQVFIKKKKDENSALKKLLLALENAKKHSGLANKA